MPVTGVPVYDMLRKYLSKGRVSFHTPGHKGHAGLIAGLASLSCDLTELPETASLFDGGDAIEQAERLAAEAFGSALTLFSAGGCTLCIQTMLKLAAAGGRAVFARNCHKSAVNAAALLGITPVWAWPTGEFGQVTARDIEDALKEPDIRAAYITSGLLWNIADIKGISAVRGGGVRWLWTTRTAAISARSGFTRCSSAQICPRIRATRPAGADGRCDAPHRARRRAG